MMKTVHVTSVLAALAASVLAVVPGATPAGDPICKLYDPYLPEKYDPIGGVDPETVTSLMNDLRDNGPCAVGTGPQTCVRVACGETSGVWVCNDNTYPIEPDCAVVAMWVDNNDLNDPEGQLNVRCGCGQYGCDVASGQLYFDEGWNIVMAYANCNLSPTLGPYQQGNGT